MAFILSLASSTNPDVFVGDGIGVFGCYGYVAVGEGFGAFGRPNEVYEKRRLRMEGDHKQNLYAQRKMK